MFKPRDFAAALLAAVFVSAAPTNAQAVTVRDGSHDFDFEFGEWQVHHRVKRVSAGDWMEFDGTASVRPLMHGTANVEDNQFNKSDGVTYGVATRTYDVKTRQWAIWWIDSRNPHGALDPPVKGSFENGVGTFFADGVVNGKTIRTRFMWSQITATSARWEQAFSADAGKTWDTNWIMEFRRASAR